MATLDKYIIKFLTVIDNFNQSIANLLATPKKKKKK